MKKGLLSLLAVALTIVSCQNYDDQFAELTGLVNTLSTDVAGITQVKSDLTALTSLVNNLSDAVDALPNPTSEIQAIASGLASATTQITAIEAALAGGVASADDLAAIDLLIDAVQADVTTLLSENAAISVPITIEDTETLVNAQKFIKVGEGTPAGYLLSGDLTVNYNSTTASLTTAERITANELTAKIISVTGDVIINGAVNLAGLTYINGDYTINGTDDPLDATVRNISGALSVNGKLGALDLSHISTVGNVTITNPVSVTSLNLTASTGGTLKTDGSGAGVAVFANATGDITIGAGFDMNSVTANKSVGAITLNQAAAAGAFVVNAPKAASITANALVSVGGATTITGSTTTNVFLNALKTSTGILSSATNKLNEFHFPALVSSVGGIDVDAKTVNAAGLKTVVTTAADFNTSNAVILTSLTSVKQVLTLDTNPVNIPLAQFSGAGDLTSAATTVIVGGVSVADMSELNVAHKYLTLMKQDADVTLDATNNANLVEFTATASGTGSTIDFIGTAAPAMTVLTINGFDTFTMAAQAAPTTLTTVTTGGTIRTFSSVGNTGLRSLTVGHTYAAAYTEAQSFVLTGAIDTAFTSLDLSSVVRLKATTITGNTSLATILAPATTDLLTAGATTGGANLYTITGNSLTATYTAATPAVSNGVTSTAAIATRVEQPSLLSWKTYINANNSVNSPTFSLDYDIEGGATSNFATDFGSGGTIDTAPELAYIR